jgi:MFS family permease
MQRFSKSPEIDKSLRHSLKDSAAFAAMAGFGETYISAFGLFLQATTAQIGLLASVPPLLASVAQLVSAWLGNLTGHRKRIILAGAGLQAIMWLPLLLLPLIFPQQALPLLILCAVFSLVGANLAAPQWSSLMVELVSERRRGEFFGIRTRVTTAVTFCSLLLGGLILNYTAGLGETVTGFAVIFLAAAIARSVSVYQLARMIDPPVGPTESGLQLNRQWFKRLYHSNAARFSVFFALMQLGVAVSSPYFTVFMLRDLQFSYLEFTIIIGTAVLAQFMTMARWGRISDVFGNRRIITVAGTLIVTLPLLWMVSGNFWYLLLVQTVSGFAWAGYSLASSNFLYDLMAPRHLASYMAAHNVLASIGLFIGATAGGYLGSITPLQVELAGETYSWISPLWSVFILSSLLRGLIMLLLIPKLKEAKRVRPIALHKLVFRVIRINALAGVVFDAITLNRKNRD